MDEVSENSEIEAAWKLFEDGCASEALDRLEELEDPAAGAALAALCWLELGDLVQAWEILASTGDEREDTFERGFAEASLALAAWRIDEARAAYSALLASEPEDAGLRERLSICADLSGDHTEADQLLQAAHELDPEAFPLPVRCDREAFLSVLDSAVKSLPPEFQAALANVTVIVEDLPNVGLIDLENLAELGDTPPDMLGLFQGPTDLDTESETPPADGSDSPTIILFQRNLERASGDPETLEREIAITLYHELAHKLGFGEEAVDAMGLG